MSTLQVENCVVAVGQMCSTNDKNRNVRIVDEIVSRAACQGGARMVFLPEASDYVGSSEEETLRLAEPIDGETVGAIQGIARQNAVWISIGVHEKTEAKVFNTQIIVNSSGELVAKYRKIHLFDVVIPEENVNLMESKTVEPGETITAPVPTPAGNVGMLICYDLRFPELSTNLRKMEASLLTYPSAFTDVTGEAHWESLLRARAIENQCYVIAAAQVGRHNDKRLSHGRSLIIDPWGKILAELPRYRQDQTADYATATISRSVTAAVRKKMPVFDHRREDVYATTVAAGRIDHPNCDMYFSDKIIPADTIFHRTRLSFAFTNIRCVVPGHVLVSSNRIVPKIPQLTNEEIADLFQAVIFVQRVMQKIHNIESTTLVVQDGADAGQTVPHVHCHILPRRPGDFEENDEIYTKLADHDKSYTIRAMREVEEMVREAQEIKAVVEEFKRDNC